MAVGGLALIASFECGYMYMGSLTHGSLVSCIEYGFWGAFKLSELLILNKFKINAELWV